MKQRLHLRVMLSHHECIVLVGLHSFTYMCTRTYLRTFYVDACVCTYVHDNSVLCHHMVLLW